MEERFNAPIFTVDQKKLIFWIADMTKEITNFYTNKKY